MASKFLILAAIAVSAKAGGLLAPAPLSYGAPLVTPLAYGVPKVVTPVALAKTEEYDPNPQYQFTYDVQDPQTGDNKNQFEQRSGDVVQGSYSLNDADGFRRIVEYTADPIHGFNAVVRREPLGAQLVAKVETPLIVAPVAKLALAQPLHYAQAAQPLHYAQPAQLHYAQPAPLAYHAPAPLTKLATPLTPQGFGFSNQIVH